MCMSNILAFLFQPEKTYWSLTLQLETVIIEVSTVQCFSYWKLLAFANYSIKPTHKSKKSHDTGHFSPWFFFSWTVINLQFDTTHNELLHHIKWEKISGPLLFQYCKWCKGTKLNFHIIVVTYHLPWLQHSLCSPHSSQSHLLRPQSQCSYWTPAVLSVCTAW